MEKDENLASQLLMLQIGIQDGNETLNKRLIARLKSFRELLNKVLCDGFDSL